MTRLDPDSYDYPNSAYQSACDEIGRLRETIAALEGEKATLYATGAGDSLDLADITAKLAASELLVTKLQNQLDSRGTGSANASPSAALHGANTDAEPSAALREQVYDAVYPVLDELTTPAPWTRTLGGMTAAIADAVMSLVTLSASPPSPPAVWSGEDRASISQSGYDAPMGASAGSEHAAPVAFSPEAKRRALDLLTPDHSPALELEEIDELRRAARKDTP